MQLISVLRVKPIYFFALILGISGCAYRFGLADRGLPGGYTQVAVPVFKNLSQDVGLETYFTDSLVRRFARSQVARVTDKEASPLLLYGTIRSVTTEQRAVVTNKDLPIPDDVVLTTEYRLQVVAHLELKRKSDERVLWQGVFSNERVYAPPRIGTDVVNSANATYNHSARRENLARLAEEMMAEAHDRMTENF